MPAQQKQRQETHYHLHKEGVPSGQHLNACNLAGFDHASVCFAGGKTRAASHCSVGCQGIAQSACQTFCLSLSCSLAHLGIAALDILSREHLGCLTDSSARTMVALWVLAWLLYTLQMRLIHTFGVALVHIVDISSCGSDQEPLAASCT